MNWRNDLSPDLQARIAWLEQYGCQFFWRNAFDGLALGAPDPAGEYVFEIWRAGRLLDYAVSVFYPLDAFGTVQLKELLALHWDIWPRFD